MSDLLKPWIERGYMTFAYEGPQGLKVEKLSNEVGKNKSSFYHHFAEIEIFIQHLLTYHLVQGKVMAAKESACTSLEELIDILVEHKIDLLFNRQLRIHRENPAFEACFIATNKATFQSIAKLWGDILDLQENTYLAGLVLKLSIENFYLQITDQTLNYHWLRNYFDELQTLVREFKRSGNFATLNGSV